MDPKFIVNARFLEKPISENNGVLRFAREISIRLKSFDSKIQFLCSKKVESNYYTEKLLPIRFGFFGGALWEQLELPLFLKRNFPNYYLLNLNNISPIFFNKNISTIHDLTWMHQPQTFNLKSRAYLSTVVPFTIRKASRILTVSNFSKADLLKNYPVNEDKVKVIYPGFYEISQSASDIADYLKQLKFDASEEKYFLAPMYKNPERLIQAFKLLDGGLDVKLVFFGKLFKNVFDHLLPQIEESDKIIYLGEVSDSELAELYSKAIAFIFPSLNEGFGAPPLEAMKSGCPVIASNVASIPEVCGDAALYIDPYNVQDIADKIRMLYYDRKLRDTLITKGGKRANCFSYDRTVLSLIDYFKTIDVYN